MPLTLARFGRSISVAFCALLGAGSASAQTTSDFFGDRWQVGGFVYVSPSYEGGKSYEVVGFPFAAPAGFGDDGALQVKAMDDIRFRLIRAGAFEFGPLAGYRFGRDESDAARLVNMGDIDGGFVVGAFGTYRAGPFAASISYHHQATGDDTGGLIRFGVEHTQRLSPALKITTSVGTNYASEDYMTSFFGVSVAQYCRRPPGLQCLGGLQGCARRRNSEPRSQRPLDAYVDRPLFPAHRGRRRQPRDRDREPVLRRARPFLQIRSALSARLSDA